MKLKDYLDEERGRQAALAREINAHAPDLSRWAEGKRPVPIPYAPLIERATGGLVSRKDLFPEDWMVIWPELAGINNVNRRKAEDRRKTERRTQDRRFEKSSP